MDRARVGRRGLALAAVLVSAAALAHGASAPDDRLREVAVLVPLSPGEQAKLRNCGFESDAIPKIVRDELELRHFRVVAGDKGPRGGEVRVRIMVAERKDGLAAWSVQLELREKARLEREPGRPVAALSWEGEKSLTIGKVTGLCRDVETRLRDSVRHLAEERLKESPPSKP